MKIVSPSKTVKGELVEPWELNEEDFFDIIKDLKSFGKSLDSRGKPAALLEALMTKPGELVSVKDLNFKLHQSTSSYLNSRIKRFNESSIHRPIELVLQTKPNAMRLTFRVREISRFLERQMELEEENQRLREKVAELDRIFESFSKNSHWISWVVFSPDGQWA